MLSAVGSRLVSSRALVDGLAKNGAKRIIGFGPVQIQVATMKATHGEKYPYSKPWPYETKNFTLLHEFFDSTSGRMNENSKVIVVEGNAAVGKNSFAKRLADEFDLKAFETTPDADCFVLNGTDIRLMDDLLPEGAKSYDLKKLYSDPHPQSGRVGRLQVTWYQAKYWQYCRALTHLFNTGQGVVIPGSVFSDNVFVDAMRTMGWVTKNFVNYYNERRAATICELLKPHLTIYLDTPLSTVKERINKRNDPREVNAPNLSDQYLNLIDKSFKERFLPKMRETGEVLEIDWAEVADDMDMDVIAEEIGMLNFEPEDNEDPQFHDWAILDEEQMCFLRRQYSAPQNMAHFFSGPVPWECPEILLTGDNASAFEKYVAEHPAIKYQPGWAPELGHGTFLKV